MNAKKLLFALLLIAVAVPAVAQDEPIAAPPPTEPAEVAAETAATPPPSEPGLHHQHLDRLAGDWDLTITLWTSLEGEPVSAAGSAEARWILGGRFLWTVYRAELLGQPFEAWVIEGYDNQAFQYVGTWRDTQGTYTLIYRGTCQRLEPPTAGSEGAAAAVVDPEAGFEGAYRRMTSQITDPASGEVFDVFNEISTREDGGGYVLRSFIALPDREPFQNLEISARRKGGA